MLHIQLIFQVIYIRLLPKGRSLENLPESDVISVNWGGGGEPLYRNVLSLFIRLYKCSKANTFPGFSPKYILEHKNVKYTILQRHYTKHFINKNLLVLLDACLLLGMIKQSARQNIIY